MSNSSGGSGPAGFTIVEVPIEWQNKGDSRVRKRDMIRMLAGLVAIRFTGHV